MPLSSRVEQVVYHIRLLHQFEHILLCGFHIEEMIYGPKYYYPELGIDPSEPIKYSGIFTEVPPALPKFLKNFKFSFI